MNSRILSILAIISSVVALCCTSAYAAPSINYQGYLTSPSGAAVNASVPMVFNLYDAVTGGNVIHTETQTVTVSNGIFNVELGIATALTAAFNISYSYWLGVTVGGDAEMTPRRPLMASPLAVYALGAESAESLAASASVDGSQITGTISTATLPAASLTGTLATAQIADASVTAAKLASNGCTGGQILKFNGAAWVCSADDNSARTLANEGAGAGIYDTANSTPSTAFLRTITGGTGGLSVTENANTISLENTLTGTNVGTGAPIYAGKDGTNLNFRSLKPGGNINFMWNATELTIAAVTPNFTGPLVGDVTGTQTATVVGTVGTVSATNVAAGANLANAATSANTANAIVKRDPSGNFTAGTITAVGDVKLGNTGQYFAPGSVDRVSIVRGIVLGNGTRFNGGGFTVARTAGAPTGDYTITFTAAFTDQPALTVSNVGSPGVIVTCTTTVLTINSFRVQTYVGGALSNQDFSLIAIGGR